MGVAVFDFFLSHSSSNKELARLVFYSSWANGLSPWYDEHLLEIGDHLTNKFKKGMDKSKSYLLLASKKSLGSDFVNIEICLALDRLAKDPSFSIKVVMLEDCELPEELLDFQYHRWDQEDIAGSVLNLMSDLTGRKPMTSITANAFLNQIPSLNGVKCPKSSAELGRNYLL